MRETASRTARRTSPEGLRLGERLRQLRVAAGLTQSELAGDRFSKEYVSQIERGKTRPTKGRSNGSPTASGSTPASSRAASPPTSAPGSKEPSRAPRRCTRRRRTRRLRRRSSRWPRLPAQPAMPELQVRALVGSGLAKMRTGEHRAAVGLLNDARSITEAESFSDVERADVLFWLGCCRYQLTSMQTALALFNEALGLAERSGLPCDALKANILSWRSRCWQRQRDFEAARDDIERALELSQGVEDLRTIGAAYFQASLIADREGHWVLARNYAERAREAYSQLSDKRSRQPADEQPRWPELPAREHGPGGQAAQGVVRDRARPGTGRRRRPRRLVARAGAPAHGRRRTGRASGASRARAARRAGSTTWTRSAAHSSCSGVPCSNRSGSTRRRRRSPPPRRASASSGQGATARPPGSHAATWQLDGGITNGRPSCTGRPQRLYRTSASRKRKEVTS